ncbi:MAG: hypothetical protein R6U41_04150 [Desulfosalsimonas sp.]|uniref:hypothetical protein n=1 Tax=Desulfosalsimonas sp. TaxID=3073848 RepID=UPI003970E206
MDRSRMYQTHPNTEKDFGRKQVEKLLAQMQSDVERGVFRLERYTGIQRTDVDQFYQEWMDEVIKRNLKPGTYKAYHLEISGIKPATMREYRESGFISQPSTRAARILLRTAGLWMNFRC